MWPNIILTILSMFAPSEGQAGQPNAQSTDASALVTLAPAPVDADAIVGKVQAYYNATKSFKANFDETITNQTFNRLKPRKSKGRVYILKPGMMRWDYKNKSKTGPKVGLSIISDATHLWIVNAKDKQYYQQDLVNDTLPVAVSFLMGTGDLRKDFNIALDTPGKYGSKADYLLLLTPKTPSARYKKLWLVVDAKDFAVKQSVVLNSKGDTKSIRFSRATVDAPSLKKQHFLFNPKAHRDFRLIEPPKNAP